MRINNMLKGRSALSLDLPKLDWGTLTQIIFDAPKDNWVDISRDVKAKRVNSIGCVVLKYKGQIVARIGQGYSHRMTYLDAGELEHTEELRDLFQKVLLDTGARSNQIECWLHAGKLIIVDTYAAYPLMSQTEAHGTLGTTLNQQIVGYKWMRVDIEAETDRTIPGDTGWRSRQRAEYLLEYMGIIGWKSTDEYVQGEIA